MLVDPELKKTRRIFERQEQLWKSEGEVEAYCVHATGNLKWI